MKKLLLVGALLCLSGCASSRVIGTEVCQPYGIFNEDTDKCDNAEYKVSKGSVVTAALLTLLGPPGWIGTGYITGWDLYQPVKEKPPVNQDTGSVSLETGCSVIGGNGNSNNCTVK